MDCRKFVGYVVEQTDSQIGNDAQSRRTCEIMKARNEDASYLRALWQEIDSYEDFQAD